MLKKLLFFFSHYLDRLNYLKNLQDHSLESDRSSGRDHLPEWKRTNFDVGEIVFVKRRLWKNASGFSTNEMKQGHPGVVTVTSKKGSSSFMLVPGTSGVPKGHYYFFSPKQKINYSSKKWKAKRTSFVLDYWRSVSRHGPFKIGKLHEADCESLQSEMVKIHRQEYIDLAYKNG